MEGGSNVYIRNDIAFTERNDLYNNIKKYVVLNFSNQKPNLLLYTVVIDYQISLIFVSCFEDMHLKLRSNVEFR